MFDKTYPTIELAARFYPRYDLFYVTSTTGGAHAKGSYHYTGRAADFGCGVENAAEVKAAHGTRFGQMNALAAFLDVDYKFITELEHTKPLNPLSGWYVKNGVRVNGIRVYGITDVIAHRTHVHVAESNEELAQGLLTVKYQRALGLTPDGNKGPKTTASVRTVQHLYGLDVDGIIGVHTVDAVRKHLNYPKV